MSEGNDDPRATIVLGPRAIFLLCYEDVHTGQHLPLRVRRNGVIYVDNENRALAAETTSWRTSIRGYGYSEEEFTAKMSVAKSEMDKLRRQMPWWKRVLHRG